ncbi:MAG: hypothetical protein QY331_07610 [Melioribacteraceae bacterium]|nr:MAG: hypothetical protein QY331_07610 [Melioribacteraceae bacterium]
MRKIQPYLESKGLKSITDLQFSLPSNVITVGLDKCDYTSPKDAADNSNSGDLIFVFPGTYDVGNNSILLKDNVNWQFMPGVTISSSSSDSTFTDGGQTVEMKFDGSPNIVNTNPSGSLFNCSNQSYVDYEMYISFILESGQYLFDFKIFDTNLHPSIYESFTVSTPYGDTGTHMIDLNYLICSGAFTLAGDRHLIFDLGSNDQMVYVKTKFNNSNLLQIMIDFQPTDSLTNRPSIESLLMTIRIRPGGKDLGSHHIGI